MIAPPTDSDESSAPLARVTIWHALLLGVAADALLRDGPVGVGLVIWIVLLVMAAGSLASRSSLPVPREAAAWLATAVLFAAGLAWRDSGLLQFADFLAMLGALAMAAVAIHDRHAALFAARLRDTLWAGVAIGLSVAFGFLPLVLRGLSVPRTQPRSNAKLLAVARAVLIAVVLLVVFGSLLRGADPIFASFVAMPAIDFGLLASHLVVTGFFAWIVGGWARGAFLAGPSSRRPPDELPVRLGLLDVTTALATLNLLFGVFVLSQLGWFFGGEEFLRARTGLTVAQYARQGFFQMVWVVVLVVPLLMATRAALRPGAALRRRHTVLSLPVIALLGAMVLSAVARLRLYVHYYGLTTDRLYPLVLMGWLVLVLVLLATTVLRDRHRLFVAGAVISGLATLVLLNVIAPDAIVARVNVARAATAPGAGAATRPVLDLGYLASLSGEAAPIALSAIIAPPGIDGDGGSVAAAGLDRCRAANRLLARWGPASAPATRSRGGLAWRTWNAGERDAVSLVGAHAAELKALGDQCPPRRRGGVAGYR